MSHPNRITGRKLFFALLSFCTFLTRFAVQAAEEDFDAIVTPFLEEHCVKCHGEKKQKGDIRLDTLGRDLTEGKTAVSWQDVSDMLKLGDMPPEKEPRPPYEDIAKLIEVIDTGLRHAAESQSDGSRISIRRLSHTALDNTVEDLLGINLLLSENLPADPEIDGFDSLAVTLDANPEMVLKLQDNAQLLAKYAITSGEDVREDRLYTVDKIGHGNNVELRDGFIITSSSRDRKHVMWPRGFVAPQDGIYRIRISAKAGDNRWDLKAAGIDFTYLDESYEKKMKKEEKRPNDELRLVTIIAIQAEEARHMDAASVPGRRVGYFYVGEKVDSDVVEVRLKEGENIMIHYASGAILNQSPFAMVGEEKMLVADLLHVNEIEVTGPLIDSWPPSAHRQLLGDNKSTANDSEVSQRIAAFLQRAFRRPVPENVVHNFTELYQNGLSDGLSREESMRYVVEGALCSSRFLFNYDKGDSSDGWALASRLSYFIWNSMPDQELLKLAESGEIRKPKVLRRQTLRMLADKKAERFVKDFTAQWLGLKHIELMKPDPKLYKDYDPLLEGLMREESEEFFDWVIKKNLPISTFLDSDFVVINERLAQHYGINGVQGSQFRPVKLSPDSPRGGLPGQASILKLTSNGTRTSPVVRGVWVLENLLGNPPAPPPPNVKPIEPDVRGSKTIREMLAKHREIDTCNDCHQKIDPWGFGLEQFDAVGAFRTQYPNGQPVDAKGQAPGGSFDDAESMKKVLLHRSDQFARALTEKLFRYALGHPLTFSEKIAAEDIAISNQKNKGGFKDLIIDICTSPLFRGELSRKDLASNGAP